MPRYPLILTLVLMMALCRPGPARADARSLLPADPADIGRTVSTDTPEEVSFAPVEGGKGLIVTCRPGKSDYPGIILKPAQGAWNLSAYGYVEARVTNTGTEPLTLCLRVDNDGDWTANPWNAENANPGPGETVGVRVRFGYSWGQRGYALDPAKVVRLLLFTNKVKAAQSFRVESVEAGGKPGEKPPVRPEDVRTVPRGGILIQPITVRLEPDSAGATFTVKPPQGRWDLRAYLQVVARIRNVGTKPIRLRARLESAPGVGPWVAAAKPTPPGGVAQIVMPFAGEVIELSAGGEAKGGSALESDRVSGVTLGAEGEGARLLELLSLRAVVPPSPALPAWLGKRPPVPGRWKQTLAEEFSGNNLNEKLWTIYHPNYWDKQAHFSRQNVILGGGMVRLRFEKKRGHADDDPAKPETDWATGFLTSTHKWTQRYGYFECRMKLPRAPGMWPAFWMMPDRGPAAGEAREDTRNGGMEFDILEYLARYGPYRYNVACHWDGYDKDHRSTGSERIYVQPDREGFYTAGLLWEPGSATFYCNGRVVARWNDPRVSSVPMYILFTAVSGGWGGNTLTGEGLPSDYVLDYVRAWQRE